MDIGLSPHYTKQESKAEHIELEKEHSLFLIDRFDHKIDICPKTDPTFVLSCF